MTESKDVQDCKETREGEDLVGILASEEPLDLQVLLV